MPPKASELQKLLAAHDSLELRGEKVVCRLSGHSMPARPAEVLVYVGGRKYQQLRAKAQEQVSLKQYEPHIVPSHGFVFCRVTGRRLPAKESAILRHSEGKRFRVGLAFAQKTKKLMDEQPPKPKEEEEEEEEELPGGAEAEEDEDEDEEEEMDE